SGCSPFRIKQVRLGDRDCGVARILNQNLHVMKTISSASVTARATIGALFFVAGLFLIVFGLLAPRLHSAQPASGTLNSRGPNVNWVGTAVGGGSTDESTCVEGVNCDTFVLTLSGTPSDWSGLKARVVISSADPS